MNCHFCGAALLQNARFCTVCGMRLVEAHAGAAAPLAGAAAIPATPDWEERGHLFNFVSFVITLREVLFSPSAAFRSLRADSSVFNALLFGLIGGTIGGLLGTFWQYSIGLLFPAAAGYFPSVFGAAALPAATVLFVPLANAVALFLVSAMNHLGLKLLSGANRPYSATFKVYAYALGSTALFSVVPLLGSVTGFIWSLVINIIGLKEAHAVSINKSALAVLAPIFCFFALAVLAVVALFLLIGAAGLSALPWLNR